MEVTDQGLIKKENSVAGRNNMQINTPERELRKVIWVAGESEEKLGEKQK